MKSALSLSAALIAVSSCDRVEPTPTNVPPPPAEAPRRADEPPPPIEPAPPDYEDVAGVVRKQGAMWVIDVEGEQKPICLPFEAPLEARVDGVGIRFTLYLAESEDMGCKPVQTLISLRAHPVPGTP